jgi:thioredoxin reductase (NADPH)
MFMLYDVVIIGSGPAGYAAGIYTGRARLSTLLITGNTPGGWAALTAEIENYPGFPEGIMGAELMENMQKQAERFGVKMVMDEVTGVDFSTHPFKVGTYSDDYEAKTVIVSTGVSPRKIGVPGEDRLTGRGVSRCATCDGFFFTDKVVAVIGGGDSAVEEGIFLTRYAKEVHIIHRRNRFRAQKVAQERAAKNEKIKVIWDSVVTEIIGENQVTGLKLENIVTGQESHLDCEGVFIFIGNEPNTHLFEGKLELDKSGYVITDRDTHTSVPGVYAAGDVQETVLKQVVTAVSAGARAAMEADKFIAEQEERTYPART